MAETSFHTRITQIKSTITKKKITKTEKKKKKTFIKTDIKTEYKNTI